MYLCSSCMHVLAYMCTHVPAYAHAQVCVVDVGVGCLQSLSTLFVEVYS